MYVAVSIACFCLVLALLAFLNDQRMRRREAEEHSIDPEVLLRLLTGHQKVLLFDVRLPLDLLAHSETIPGAVRLPPKEVEAQSQFISKEADIVIYGTCLNNQTLHLVLRMTQRLKFHRLKMLRGGFEGWKQKGLPVEAYTTPFHLDTPT